MNIDVVVTRMALPCVVPAGGFNVCSPPLSVRKSHGRRSSELEKGNGDPGGDDGRLGLRLRRHGSGRHGHQRAGRSRRGGGRWQRGPTAAVAVEDPDAFAATVDAVERYLAADRAGNLRLAVPAQIAGDLDAQALAALQHSVAVYNDLNRDGGPAEVTDAETFGIPSAILAFVKSNWKKIVDIAKKSGKWAWYKSVQCSAGAANALYRNYGNDVAAMAANAKVAVAIAGAGCVANL
ncbi:hypothetical protein [Micromonospora sp. NPDC126480]|uniref:hypothetical protein n=1 Tax=Micromonospora sp. NPDC126480 TaxID=3155312 RepID=UPI00332A3042